jgi:DNA-binding response OmpR family regulator
LASQVNKRRILVVDNEPDITITLQIGLEAGGFDVDAFTDPKLALSSFKPGLYDLVLIDIMMPKMDGFALYERKLEKKTIVHWTGIYFFKSQCQMKIL